MMNAYEIKEAVTSADLNDSPQIEQLLVLITDKLVDLEYELNQLRRQKQNKESGDNYGGPNAIPRSW